MSINVYNLELTIAKLLGVTSAPDTILKYAKAIKNANIGSVITVDSFQNLPSAATTPAGSLYFVEFDRAFYLPNNVYNIWTTLIQTDIISNAWTWGRNFYGRLGDNTLVNKTSPVSVVGGFTDWCQLSGGRYNTAAVRTNGTLWTWGRNVFGELGNNAGGTGVLAFSPVSVVGGFTDWCQVSAGAHIAAVKTNCSLWAWGLNNTGQLGDNTTVNKSSPVSVVGGFSNWCRVSAGTTHTAAVRTNGTLWTWGNNISGRLGDNTTVNKSSPVSVVGGFTDWCQVSAGDSHTAAVRTNGSLWAWGDNGQGRLGDNTIIAKSSPVSVVGGFTNWCQVSTGGSFTAAVRTNGTIWAWGFNCTGQLGDNTCVSKSSPVSVVGGFTDWCQVSTGDTHTTAMRTNGTIWAWGNNVYGQLGDNTSTAKSSPISVLFGVSTWCQVSAGGFHTAALNSKIY